MVCQSVKARENVRGRMYKEGEGDTEGKKNDCKRVKKGKG